MSDNSLLLFLSLRHYLGVDLALLGHVQDGPRYGRWKERDSWRTSVYLLFFCLRVNMALTLNSAHSDSGVDAGVKLRPSAEELNDELGSQFSQRWTEHFANAPDKPVIWMGPASA